MNRNQETGTAQPANSKRTISNMSFLIFEHFTEELGTFGTNHQEESALGGREETSEGHWEMQKNNNKKMKLNRQGKAKAYPHQWSHYVRP